MLVKRVKVSSITIRTHVEIALVTSIQFVIGIFPDSSHAEALFTYVTRPFVTYFTIY